VTEERYERNTKRNIFKLVKASSAGTAEPASTSAVDAGLPLIPTGWTYLVHGTNLTNPRWDGKHKTLFEEDVLVIENYLDVQTAWHTKFLKEIEGEKNYAERFSGPRTNVGISEEEYSDRNRRVQIRVIFPSMIHRTSGLHDKLFSFVERTKREELMTFVERYYWPHRWAEDHPSVPEGTWLIKLPIPKTVEDGAEVLYYIPSEMKDVYEQQIAQMEKGAEIAATEEADPDASLSKEQIREVVERSMKAAADEKRRLGWRGVLSRGYRVQMILSDPMLSLPQAGAIRRPLENDLKDELVENNDLGSELIGNIEESQNSLLKFIEKIETDFKGQLSDVLIEGYLSAIEKASSAGAAVTGLSPEGQEVLGDLREQLASNVEAMDYLAELSSSGALNELITEGLKSSSSGLAKEELPGVLAERITRRLDEGLVPFTPRAADVPYVRDMEEVLATAEDLGTACREMIETLYSKIDKDFGPTPASYGLITYDITLEDKDKELLGSLASRQTFKGTSKFRIISLGKISIEQAMMEISRIKGEIGPQPLGIIAGPEIKVEDLAHAIVEAEIEGVFISSQEPADIEVDGEFRTNFVVFEAMLASLLLKLKAYDPDIAYSVDEIYEILPPITSPEFVEKIEALKRDIDLTAAAA